MKRSLLTIVITIALATPVVAAPAARFDLDTLKLKHEKFVLDNGLTLLVHEDHSVPIVAVNLAYHVGSRNERRGRTGFAHLFEHFFFNGSKNYPHGFREAMDDLGANNRNGSTNNDRTNFIEDVPVQALERTLYLEADRMGFLGDYINEAMLERERGVVQNEKRQGENEPYGRVYDRVVESIYPYSHPYSWSTIGTMEDLQGATLPDVKEWYRSYYGPNNCVIALAGDITPKHALALVTKYFGAIPPNPPVDRYESWIPKLERNVRDQMQDRVPQARIHRVYHLPRWGDPDLHRMELFAGALSGSRSAPLDRRLVFEKQLATEVSADVYDQEIASILMIEVTVRPGVDPATAEAEMDAVVAELLERGPTDDELNRAKSRLVARFARASERLGGFGGRANFLAESMTFGGDPDAYLERLRNLTSADTKQVAASARKWLDANHYTLLVVPYPKFETPKETLDRSIVPALGENPTVNFPVLQRAALKNGLKVILLERHTAPLVNMTLAVDAGYASDAKGKEGIASLALGVLDDGTSTRDLFRIADDLDSLGATIETVNEQDASYVKLRALRMNLEPSLSLFADIVLHPAFSEEMIAIARKQTLAAIRQEKATPRSAARRLMPKLLYGAEHAYGRPATGSGYERVVEGLKRADLVAWHGAWFVPGNATLVVTGDVTMKELLRQLESSLGGWSQGTVPSKKIETTSSHAKGKVFLLDKPGAPQSVIVVAQLSQPGGQPDELAMEVVMRNFGEMATARLNRNLRLDKHWSYGATGSILDARGQRPLFVVAPVQSDKTRESMAEVMKEIRGVAGERPLAGEEFASIMRNMVMRLPGRFETLAALESAALDVVNYGYSPEYYYDYAKNLRALGEKELAVAAARFIKPDELTWMVVGDVATIEAGIRSLGFGEVVRLDADGNVMK